MNQLKPFNFEGNKVRVILIENEPYFVGKDLTDVLGYQNGSRDINQHVDLEDRLKYQISTAGQMREQTVVSESGVYSLIFSSHLESAKRFKHWVTSEILPEIRKNGSYRAKPLTAAEKLALTVESVVEIDQRVKALEDDQSLSPSEYSYLSRRVNQKVAEYISVHSMKLNRKQRSRLFKDISSGLNEVTNVRTRIQIRKKDFEVACEFIEAWTPAIATVTIIGQLSSELIIAKEA